MSEFLVRGYNVAVPEIDDGDDLFVVTTSAPASQGSQAGTSTPPAFEIRKVQIKTCSSKSEKYQINLNGHQLQKPQPGVELFYVFVFYNDINCLGYLIKSRVELVQLYDQYRGSPQAPQAYPSQLTLSISVRQPQAIFWKQQTPLNDWTAFPPISR